jgi:predicted nucleic acid-binding protein
MTILVDTNVILDAVLKRPDFTADFENPRISCVSPSDFLAGWMAKESR